MQMITSSNLALSEWNMILLSHSFATTTKLASCCPMLVLPVQKAPEGGSAIT